MSSRVHRGRRASCASSRESPLTDIRTPKTSGDQSDGEPRPVRPTPADAASDAPHATPGSTAAGSTAAGSKAADRAAQPVEPQRADRPQRTSGDVPARTADTSPTSRFRKRAAAVIAATTLLGAAAGVLGSSAAGETYTSEADVLYDPTSVQLDDTPATDPNLLDRQVADQADVVTSDAVLGAAASTLGTTTEDLREIVSVTVGEGSSLLTIASTGDTAAAANEVTRSVTDAYVTYVKDNSVSAITQRADILQGTIDRQNTQLAGLNEQLAALTNQLGGLSPTGAAYGVVQGQLDRLADQVGQLSARNADLVEQQESLRASATAYPGAAFVLRQPSQPESPSSLSPLTSGLVGAVLGALVGACIVGLMRARHRPPALAGGSGSTSSR